MSIIEEALNKKEKSEKKTDFTLLKEEKSKKKRGILILFLIIFFLLGSGLFFYINFITVKPQISIKPQKIVNKPKIKVNINNDNLTNNARNIETKKPIEKKQKSIITSKNKVDNSISIIKRINKRNLKVAKKPKKISIRKNKIKNTNKKHPKKQQLSNKDQIEKLLIKAYKNLNAGNIMQAVVLYTKVLKLDNSSKEALINRAIAYQKINEFSKAEKDLLKALKISKNKEYIYNVLGVLYMKQNKNDMAIKFFKKSNTSESYVNIALIYWKENNIGDVYKNLSYAIAIDPQNGYAHLYLGIFFKQLGKKEQAKKEFEKASVIAKEKGDLNLLNILSKYY